MSGVRASQHPPTAAGPDPGVVVQLVRIPACHAGGRGFESRPLRQPTFKGEREFALFRCAARIAMFDFMHRRKRVVQFILALITLPFAFFGVDYYFRSTEPHAGCRDRIRAADHRRQEFAEAIREQQERMRQIAGRNFDPAVFDDPEVRYSILEQLINQRLLQEQARRDRFRVSDAQVAQLIADDPGLPGRRQVLARSLRAAAAEPEQVDRCLRAGGPAAAHAGAAAGAGRAAPTSSRAATSSATWACSTSSARSPQPRSTSSLTSRM